MVVGQNNDFTSRGQSSELAVKAAENWKWKLWQYENSDSIDPMSENKFQSSGW